MKLLKNAIRCMRLKLKHAAEKRCFPEMVVYIIVWTIVFLFPVVEAFFDMLSGSIEAIRWKGIFMLWTDVVPFLLLFLLNNCVLVPRLFLKQKVGAYITSAVFSTMLVMSLVTLCGSPFPDGKRQMIEARMQHEHPERLDRDERLHNGKPDDFRPPKDFNPDFSRQHKQGGPFFLPLIRGPFFGRMMIALLMLSFNIAVKLFFKSLRDKEAMKELERQNLQSELEYLKYQINPHFFMNTLNNIHALVDIDTEKAKQTIVELSKLMRYMLYEANKRTVLLAKEVHFLRNYIELMRIRYPESVHIDLLLSEDTGGIQVPPLLFVSFVENAFKHGVSYQKDSFIAVSLEIEDGSVLFHCSNSNYGKTEDQYHGIGLENIRKRLQLLYDGGYTLSINESEHRFDVLMVIPID